MKKKEWKIKYVTLPQQLTNKSAQDQSLCLEMQIERETQSSTMIGLTHIH